MVFPFGAAQLMIASVQSLADKMRRVLGPSEKEAADLKSLGEKGSGAGLLRRKRILVALMAIIFGAVSGVIELPLPAEDGFRLARAQLRVRPVPQDIVVIAIDDATLNELGVSIPTLIVANSFARFFSALGSLPPASISRASSRRWRASFRLTSG